jgi:hypothetical protein
MPGKLSLIAVVLALAALAGCAATGSGDSSGDFRGEQRSVASVVEDLQSAGSKGDEDDICTNLLAAPLARRMGARRGGCARAVNAARKDADAFDLKVESVRIQGSRATARVRADRGDRDELTTLGLVKSGATWRITDLG